jgi:hypothetical protein
MIVSVHQPQYLPWLGYFDKIDRADVFVLLDTVQYKKNEWQNRNRIKTAQGPQWLTVPVTYRYPQRICEVGVNGRERWQHRQRQALATNYRRAPHWGMLEDFFEDLFRGAGSRWPRSTSTSSGAWPPSWGSKRRSTWPPSWARSPRTPTSGSSR